MRLSGTKISATVDPASASPGTVATNDVTVPGALVGDFVFLSVESHTAEGILYGFVSANDTVTLVSAPRDGASGFNQASTTYRVKVVPQDHF